MKNKTEKKFRILNKTKDTVTLKIGNQTVTRSWEEFGQTFDVKDKVWAVPNKEQQEKEARIESLIQMGVDELKKVAVDGKLPFFKVFPAAKIIAEELGLLEGNIVGVLKNRLKNEGIELIERQKSSGLQVWIKAETTPTLADVPGFSKLLEIKE